MRVTSDMAIRIASRFLRCQKRLVVESGVCNYRREIEFQKRLAFCTTADAVLTAIAPSEPDSYKTDGVLETKNVRQKTLIASLFVGHCRTGRPGKVNDLETFEADLTTPLTEVRAGKIKGITELDEHIE